VEPVWRFEVLRPYFRPMNDLDLGHSARGRFDYAFRSLTSPDGLLVGKRRDSGPRRAATEVFCRRFVGSSLSRWVAVCHHDAELVDVLIQDYSFVEQVETEGFG